MPGNDSALATQPIFPATSMHDDIAEPYRSRIEGRPVLLFDGVCALCNRTVQFFIRHDLRAALLFVPLESALGKHLLDSFSSGFTEEGVVLITNTLTPSARLSRCSEAVSDALRLLPPPWNFFGAALRLIPQPLREYGYSLVARYRYRLFGRYAACPVPTPSQRSRILGTPI